MTTILTAALKEAIKGQEKDLGIIICGGKGKTSRKTPDEINLWGDRLVLAKPAVDNLVYNSKMSAKIDSSLVQDGFQIYHHAFFFAVTKRKENCPLPAKTDIENNEDSPRIRWTVVQQGMNAENVTARRYHWHSANITDLVCEPHSGIATQTRQDSVLNLTSKKSTKTRKVSTDLVSSSFNCVMRDIEILRKHSSNLSRMISMKRRKEVLTLLELADTEFSYHPVVAEDFSKSKYLEKILRKVTEEKPQTYEEFLATEGVGPKTVRALSLVSEVIYGAKPSYEDPARYSFAHGGKDATPYPVDRETYDQTIHTLSNAVRKSKINPVEKDKALRRLLKQA